MKKTLLYIANCFEILQAGVNALQLYCWQYSHKGTFFKWRAIL